MSFGSELLETIGILQDAKSTTVAANAITIAISPSVDKRIWVRGITFNNLTAGTNTLIKIQEGGNTYLELDFLTTESSIVITNFVGEVDADVTVVLEETGLGMSAGALAVAYSEV